MPIRVRCAWVCILSVGAVLSCGAGEADQRRVDAIAATALFSEVESVGAFIDPRGRRACTGTVVGDTLVLTSARCAHLAVNSRLSFAASEAGAGMQRTRRAQAVSGRTLDADAGRPMAACRAVSGGTYRTLAQACRVDDILGLGLSHQERLCVVTRLTPFELAEHELVGLANWRDRAQVLLDQPAGLTPAGLHPDSAGPFETLWVVGTRSLRENDHSVRRYIHRWREVARNGVEIHAEAESPVVWVDIGAALFAEVASSQGVRLALVGVASRPFVAHGDASAGMIFARARPGGEAATP